MSRETIWRHTPPAVKPWRSSLVCGTGAVSHERSKAPLVSPWLKDTLNVRSSSPQQQPIYASQSVLLCLKRNKYKLDQTLLPAWKSLGEGEAKRAWAEGSAMSLEHAIQYSLGQSGSAISP